MNAPLRLREPIRPATGAEALTPAPPRIIEKGRDTRVHPLLKLAVIVPVTLALWVGIFHVGAAIIDAIRGAL